MPDLSRQRLNSWKEISTYLHRDVRTVARWEKLRGLPVHRLPGGGGSVFAYRNEIDEWLAGGGADDQPAETPAPAPAPSPPHSLAGSRFQTKWAGMLFLALALVVVVAVADQGLWPRHVTIGSVEVRGSDLIAFAPSGAELWRYPFGVLVRPPGNPPTSAPVDFDADGDSEVFAVVGKVSDHALDDEALYFFESDGSLNWERRLTDVVNYRDGRYAPPWSSGPATIVRMDGESRILWAVHHHTWWPSILSLFDRTGNALASFRHAGWITSLASTPDGTVLAGGFSNHHDAEVLMVLDRESWPGAGPSAAGTSFECLDCPDGRPLRYFVLPRLELNRLTDLARQKAHIHVHATGTDVRIVQDAASQFPPEFILELTQGYRPATARASDHYWRWHQQLEAAGKVTHTAADCPERRGFRIRQWERGKGWTDIEVPAVQPAG